MTDEKTGTKALNKITQLISVELRLKCEQYRSRVHSRAIMLDCCFTASQRLAYKSKAFVQLKRGDCYVLKTGLITHVRGSPADEEQLSSERTTGVL